MAIQFKFRSSVNFDTLDIDGRPSISIGDLKSRIIRMKNLDTCQNFDLVFSDARTGQDLVDEKFKIPSGSCVIVKRVPAGSVPSNVVHHDLFGNFHVKDNDMVNSSRPVNAETEDFNDFGVDLLYPIQKANSSISHNNTNNDAVRHYKETERGYIKPEESGISEAIQGDSSHGTTVGGTALQTSIKLNIGAGTGLEKPVVAMPSVIHDREIPSELKCALCNSLFVDAVIIGCCKHSFCEKCIRPVLLEKAKCPKCASTIKSKLEDLLPNFSLRQTVAHFLQSQILMGDSDNAYHLNVPDEESRIEGNDMPCFSSATGRGSNQEVVEYIHDSSLRRNMQKSHPENVGGRPEDLPPFDDCQGENQPVFGDFKHGASDIPGKIHNLTDFRKHKKRGRACYMCGSLDHIIRDCPVASKPHPMHLMGATPYYASPWNPVSPFTNLYGCPMAFNTLVAPEANSYWTSIYGGYPIPSGTMCIGGMTAPPPLGRKTEEFCAGYSEFIDVNDCNKKRKIPNSRMRVMSFTNEAGSGGEDDVAKRCQKEREERSMSYRMDEEKEHPRRENVKDDERRWLNDEKRKISHSSRDPMLNRFNERLESAIEGLPGSNKLLTKERSGHHHRYFREAAGRTDECCSHSSSNHSKRCEQKEAKINTIEVDCVSNHRYKHHRCSESDLERSLSSNQRLVQKGTGFISRCSSNQRLVQKGTGFISRCSKSNKPTHVHRQMVSGPNGNREECNHKYKQKRFVERNY